MYDTLLTIATVEDACVVDVKSDIDIANADTFQRYVDEASTGTHGLVVSLANCTYIDSTGLRVLIGWAKARGSAFGVVVTPGSRVRRVFDLTDLDRIVGVYETTDIAVTATRRKPEAVA